MRAAECAFKKTCLLERVTSQWRYERGESQKERRERAGEGSKKSKGEEKVTGKVGHGRNGKRSRER